MTGMMQALLGAGLVSSSGYRTTLAAGTVNYTAGLAAYLGVNPDGTITVFGGGGSIANHAWFTPTTTGKGTGHYLRATAVSGATLDPDNDWWPGSGWVSLAGVQNLGIAAGTGTGVAVYTLEIATDSGGSNIVCTGTYTFGN